MFSEVNSFTPTIHEFTTSEKYGWLFSKPFNSGSINFTVKALSDACISLAEDPNISDKGYEVVIGAMNNSMTTIQRLKDEKERVKIKTPDILSPSEERGYWVSWNGGLIGVGKKDNSEPIVSWKDPDPITITHYAVCTGCFTEVIWVIEDVWKLDTEEKSGYRYRPILWGSMKTTIKGTHDVVIQLSSNSGNADEFYKIALEAALSPGCTFYCKDSKEVKAQTTTANILSKDTMVYVTWFNGIVRVFCEDRRLLIAWEDPNPFAISTFGVENADGLTAHFTVQAAMNHFTDFPEPDKAEYKFTTPAQFKYNFNPFLAGSINFTVKTKQDAMIQLSDDARNEENCYWVVIGCGKNKRSAIRRGKEEKVWISTPGILSGNEYKGFWVSWDERGVAVGKEGHKWPFMRWTDPKPVNVTLYGVTSGSGSTGEWVIEGFQKIPTPEKVAVQKHFPITWGSLRVSIDATCDAHIALSSVPQESNQMYHITLGSKHNTTSEILYNMKKLVKAHLSTPGILAEGQTVHLIITWSNGEVAVFTHDEKTGSNRLLLAWKDTNQIFRICYYGVTTSDQSTGQFTVTGPSMSRLIVSVTAFKPFKPLRTAIQAVLGVKEPAINVTYQEEKAPRKYCKSLPTPDKYDFKTPAKLDYQYKAIMNGSINFTFKGSGDAFIALTNRPEEKVNAYEITLRTNPNQVTMIQLREKKEVMAAVETVGILSGDEPKGFWIRWYNGCIDVGQKGNNLPFLRWTDPEPVSVTHFGVKTIEDVYGDWVIEDFWKIKTHCRSSEYDYKPIMWGHVAMTIMAESQARVEITPGAAQKHKCYQIVFGNEKNQRCTILYGETEVKADVVADVLDENEPLYFYLTWFNGCINVFANDKNLLVASEDTTAQLAFSLIGVTTEVCTGEFSVWPSLDHVTITESSTERGTEFITLEKFEFTYARIISGSIHFAVRAFESAIIKLFSCDLAGEPVGYVIILGDNKNTQCIIKSIGDDDPYKAMTKTEAIIDEDESREFWIKWDDEIITVGKKGSMTPFLSWYDDALCSTTRYEVNTPQGTAGAWLIEGSLKIVTPLEVAPEKRLRPILWGHLRLRILGSKEAHISLSTVPESADESWYHIIIGASNNTLTQAYCGSKHLASACTPGILSPEKIEDFEITWCNGSVNLLHLNQSVLVWKDEKPFGIFITGLSGWAGAKVYFQYDASLDHITPSGDICTPNELSFITPGVKHYQYKPITCGSINFTVKAHSDAHITLTDNPHKKVHPYEIILGMMSNQKTAIRKGKFFGENASTMTPGILSGDEHRAFWIRWNNGTIAVGEKGKLMPIVQWADPEPFPALSHYGLRTKMNYYGEWVIEDFWEFQTEDNSDYCFHPILWGRADVVLNPKHGGIFALSTVDGDCDKKYQMQLGSSGNIKCHISIGAGDGVTTASVETPNYVKEGDYIPFLLTWFNGLFYAFNKERKLVIASEDSSPPAMCYFGTASYPGAFGYFTASPSLDHFIPSDSFSTSIERQQHEIDTFTGGKYQFKPITSGRINFAVKAKNDAHIVLTNDPAEENGRFWIVIGGWGNTETAIHFGKTWEKNYSYINTPGILNGDEFRGFWISWNGGSVAVGKKGSVVPFLRWVDAKPIVVTHCGILTGSGSNGEWVIEGFQKYSTVDDGKYTHFPILWGVMDVTIIAPQDGHVALTTGPAETLQMYHIAIGMNGNTASEICYGNRNSTEVHVDTPDILSKDKEKKFLITWFNGLVNVLFEDRLLLAWEDPNPVFMITHFGVSTSSDIVGHFTVRPSLESFTPSELIKPSKFVFTIPVTETYVFKPITQGSINFSVKASSDAHVALAEGTDDDCHLKYEIIFGANGNEKTVIRKQDKTGKKEDKAWVKTQDILKVDEPREFWVKWNNGIVAAGKKGRGTPILQWVDLETASVVTHYAVGGGASGEFVEWLIEDTTPVPNTDVGNYVYEPIVWGRLDVTVNAPNDARIALKTNLKDEKILYTIALGTSDNAKSSISYGEGEDTLQAEVNTPCLLSEGIDTPFLIIWFNSVTAVYFNNQLLLSWENDDEVKGVGAFGVGAWDGARGLFTATASLDHFTYKEPPTVDRKEYHFKTPAKFEYQFKRILSGAINFTLKTKLEAQVKFSNDLCKHHSTYKVTFGQNSKWTSISKKGLGEQAKVATPGILSDKDSRGFWISWHDGTIDVGQKGSNRPLVRWTDPEPEYITHYAVCTLGSVGNWVIEDFWKITTYPKWKYGFREIKWGSLDVIVNAPYDAHIALTTARAHAYQMYQISLGTLYNSKCEIRFGSKEEEKTSVDLRHVLTKGKDRSFHITWFNGDVEVYSSQKMMTDSYKLLLKWMDKDSFLINHFGVSTGANSEGRFTVYPSLEHVKMTDDSQESKKKKTVETVNVNESNFIRNALEVEI